MVRTSGGVELAEGLELGGGVRIRGGLEPPNTALLVIHLQSMFHNLNYRFVSF